MPEARLQRARDINEEKGEPHLVYMGPEYGDKRCDRCEYWPSPNRCNHPEIMKLAKAGEGGLTPDMVVGDLVRVGANGCSDYFEPRDEEWEGDHDAGEK